MFFYDRDGGLRTLMVAGSTEGSFEKSSLTGSLTQHFSSPRVIAVEKMSQNQETEKQQIK